MTKCYRAELTEAEHLRLATFAVQNRSTLEGITTLALRELLAKLKRGRVRLPQDGRIEANRKRRTK